MTAGESNPGSLRDSEALASLTDDERLYREIVESSDDAILVKTPEGVIVSWNRGAERLYGYSAQEALDSHVSLIVPEERQGEEQSILSTVLRGRDLSWIDEYPKKVAALKLDDVNETIHKRVDPNKLVTAEAGTFETK